jgi:hypothetical protein
MIEHNESAWDRVIEVVSDTGEKATVKAHWDSHDGYAIDNWYNLPNWLTDMYEDEHEMAQDLDEKTYMQAYNKQEVNA